jgi:cell division transport system permease protein
VSRRASPAARVLDEAGGVRAMTAIMGIMVFLLVLAAALGLATRSAANGLDAQLAGRLTVQVAIGDAAARDRAARAIAVRLRALPGVAAVTPVPQAELDRLLEPWLGAGAGAAGVPVPALIDVDLGDDGSAERVAAAVRGVTADASVDAHARWMAPVRRLLGLMSWLAALLVLLVAGATVAVVMLAVRNGLAVHRGTIEVMHMLGSTDVQVARLFQRRIALDALVGGGAGGVLALAVAWIVGRQAGALGSGLTDMGALGRADWVLLALLPVLFVLLATLAARRAAVARLGRTL